MRPTTGGGIVLERESQDMAGALSTITVGSVNFGAGFASQEDHGNISELGPKIIAAIEANDDELVLEGDEAATLRRASKISLRNADLALGVAFAVQAERRLQPEEVLPAMRASDNKTLHHAVIVTLQTLAVSEFSVRLDLYGTSQ